MTVYVREEARICFVAHPRTASRAVRTALTEGAGFRQVGSHHSLPGDDEDDVGVDPGSWTILSAVRNHFEVLCSWDRKFGGHVVEWNAAWWADWFADGRGSLYAEENGDGLRLFYAVPLSTDVLRHESLERDLNRVLRREGLPAVELPEPDREPSNGETYRTLVPADVRAWAEEAFGSEMNELGYGWGSP